MVDAARAACSDAALGAFVGACIGDAAGAVLEFSSSALRGDVPTEQVEAALQMQGGGYHRVGPGQITDDSELAICLAQGLLASSPPHLPLEEIARMYVRWHDSNPFDMGFTCQRAFSAGSEAFREGKPVADSILARTQNAGSMASEANGALMRCTPLAIWAHRLEPEIIAQCAFSEASLSHPNMTCKEVNAVYCIAMASLIQQPGRAGAAIKAATDWAVRNASPAVKLWLSDALSGEALPKVAGNDDDGWVRWAFMLSFRHLKLGSSYETALRDTLSRGGDVDTNSAIVGGLLGALHGFRKLPEAWRSAVINRHIDSIGQPVSEFLLPHQVPELTKSLFEMAISVP